MRLFTALWLPEDAGHDLDRELRRVRAKQAGALEEATGRLRGFRFIPADRWHLTLCFHGDNADPDWLADRLSRRVGRLIRTNPGFGPPRLRLASAGTFGSVLWIGLQVATEHDDAALRGLVRAAGADPHDYVGHLTVARWGRGRATRGLSALFDEYQGPWWTAAEITLVRSDLGRSGPVYETVHRVPLTSGTEPDDGVETPDSSV